MTFNDEDDPCKYSHTPPKKPKNWDTELCDFFHVPACSDKFSATAEEFREQNVPKTNADAIFTSEIDGGRSGWLTILTSVEFSFKALLALHCKSTVDKQKDYKSPHHGEEATTNKI